MRLAKHLSLPVRKCEEIKRNMKKGRRVAIVLAFMVLSAFQARAYDFSVRMNSGDTLFFEVIDSQKSEVAVVPPNIDGPDYYSGHRKIAGVLVIPSEVYHNGQRYAVTVIGERAFSGCSGIRMVSIPKSITVIGDYAFYGCVGINDPVVIDERVTRVGMSAFYGCTQLPGVVFKARKCEFMGGSLATVVFGNCKHLKKVTIAEGVTMIPDYAFSGLDALSNPVILPNSLRYIGDYAFSFCSKLPGSIVIPDGVMSIGECAFNQCHSIAALTIGARVDTIGSRAFHKCIGLKTVTLNTSIPPRIERTAFSNLPKTVVYRVPCASKVLYEKNEEWKKLSPFELFGDCTLKVEVEAAIPEQATVLGSGDYMFGDSVQLIVACAAGYGFVSWSDGSRENPRTLIVNGETKLRAYTHVANTIILKDTIYEVDTVYSEGYKVINDTVDVFTALQSIDGEQKTISYDSGRKLVVWNIPKEERVLSVMVFDAKGECLYKSDRSTGKLKTRRFPTGSYILRVETASRVESYRIFINNE